jgi:hypothetical protein
VWRRDPAHAETRLAPDERLARDGRFVGRAGLEPESLRFCLDAVFAEPPFAAPRAVIERPPGDALRVTYLEVDDGCPDD